MLRAAAFDCIVFAAGAAATACETALLEFTAATSRQLLLSLSILSRQQLLSLSILLLLIE